MHDFAVPWFIDMLKVGGWSKVHLAHSMINLSSHGRFLEGGNCSNGF